MAQIRRCMKRSSLVPGWKDSAKGTDAPQLGHQSIFQGRVCTRTWVENDIIYFIFLYLQSLTRTGKGCGVSYSAGNSLEQWAFSIELLGGTSRIQGDLRGQIRF